MIRAVVDTNILVRAVIKPTGSVGPVLQRLRRREYLLLASRETLDELATVLHRPRLRTKYELSDRVLRATIRMVVLRSELLQPDHGNNQTPNQRNPSQRHVARVRHFVRRDNSVGGMEPFS
jgi:putative PIN family toxin of toxin-antitoxin system